ncbi:glycosyltransferase family 4 protein [Rhizobium lentis]|uniref:glycosyltransferase family 4 protein n=1 Tax=Rhizobium lentis TaxID=1138194 RepID=UPI001FEC36F2|nr:glycosyltransferase family 4 protein [Rhizobium lentis]
MTGRSNKAARRRILMSVDAVGGVWRYALDLAVGLKPLGLETIFAVFGPRPSAEQVREAEAIGKLIYCDAPLDWMAETEADVKAVPGTIAELAVRERADLVHLNLPSQAAAVDVGVPVVVVSHSCVSTWFHAVRGSSVPEAWQWQERLNRQGFDQADAVLAPSRSHAALLGCVYGTIDGLQVIHNASRVSPAGGPKDDFVFAAGRWWDDGKNGAVLDAAAPEISWPVVMAGSNRGPTGQYVPIEKARNRGELSHAETMQLMGKAAIVVSPSLYEPFGLAVLEAARCGSALVVADIPTYRELWDGAALFADPHDPRAFAAAVNRLVRDPSLRTICANRARIRSLDFTAEAQANAVARLYTQILSTKSALTAAE